MKKLLAFLLIAGGIFCLVILSIYLVPLLLSTIVALSALGWLAFFTLAFSGIGMLLTGLKKVYELLNDAPPDLLERVNSPGKAFIGIGEYVASIGAVSFALFAMLCFEEVISESFIFSIASVVYPLLFAMIAVGVALMISGYVYESYKDSFSKPSEVQDEGKRSLTSQLSSPENSPSFIDPAIKFVKNFFGQLGENSLNNSNHGNEFKSN